MLSPRNGGGASEQPRLAADEYAFEREHLFLGLGAAGRGKSAELAASRKHAVARDDQRHGIARHRDADILRCLRLSRADALRKLAISDGLAKPDLAQCLVDRTAERIDTGEIEPDGVEVDAFAREVA